MKVSNWHKLDKNKSLCFTNNLKIKFDGTLLCSTCKLTKLTHHFFFDKSRKLGLSPRCKACDQKRRNRNYLISNFSSF